MTDQQMLILAALVCGMAITLQAHCMGQVDKQWGTLSSVLLTYLSGTIIIGLLWAVYASGKPMLRAGTLPWPGVMAGALGVIIVGSIGYCAPRLGLVRTLTVVVAAQFITAAVIDHFGWLGAQVRPMVGSAWLGMVLMLGGVVLVMRP